MTNKINGIDVSKCAYYNKDNEPYCCEIWENECEAQNCYFKQLKRLQEENKRLQMLSCANCGEKYLSPDGAELYEKNVQLQKENEELKKKNEKLKKKNDEYFVANINYEVKIEDLTQALEEIMDIVSDEIDKTDTDDELLQLYGTIYNICNEVLDDRD